jgi:hypothetical protein
MSSERIISKTYTAYRWESSNSKPTIKKRGPVLISALKEEKVPVGFWQTVEKLKISITDINRIDVGYINSKLTPAEIACYIQNIGTFATNIKVKLIGANIIKEPCPAEYNECLYYIVSMGFSTYETCLSDYEFVKFYLFTEPKLYADMYSICSKLG